MARLAPRPYRSRDRAIAYRVLVARPSTVTATVDQMKIHASSRPRDDHAAEPHRFTIECTDYAAGVAEAEASLPEGWILTHVQVDRE